MAYKYMMQARSLNSRKHTAMASKHHFISPVFLFLTILNCNLSSCLARQGAQHELQDLDVRLLERAESHAKVLTKLGALANNPKFKDSFRVKDSYIEFLKALRKDVIKYCTPPRPGTVVHQSILPKAAKTLEWFQLDITTAERTGGPGASISLAIRLDNLYLVGFRTQAGTWWEFGKEGAAHLIRNSRFLGFGEQYGELIGQNKLPTVTLGRDVLAKAVANLAAYTGKGTHDEPKAALARLAIMICEGLRFLSVTSTVDGGFKTGGGGVVKLSEVQALQVNNWEKISKVVLEVWAVKQNASAPELKPLGINNINDAARIVALVLDVRKGRQSQIEAL